MSRLSFRLNRAIHSFTRMEQTSTTAITGENSTLWGWMILSRELLASSKPMMIIMADTARPDRYSNRAWP